MLLAGCGVLALILWDLSSVLRAVGVLGYLAVAPGLACARLIRIPDGPSQFVVGVALSLALGVLVAQGMIHLHRWSPMLGLTTLIGIASVAALIRLGLDLRYRGPDVPVGGGMTDIAFGLARAGPVQAAVLTLLVLALIARIVVQLTAPSARRTALRILDLTVTPLLLAFVLIILQRFRDLS